MSGPDRGDPVVAEKERVMRAGKPVGKAFLTAAVLVVLTLSLGGTSASKGVDRTATYEQLKLFTDVLSIIQNQYVDETEPKEVIYGAVRGMLRVARPALLVHGPRELPGDAGRDLGELRRPRDRDHDP